MNQELYKQRNRNVVFWSVTAVMIVMLYVPLFFVEYNLRQDQLSRGVRPDRALPVMESDTFEYATLAKNLLTNKVFSLDGKTPETFRTIGYPAVVSIYLARGLPLVTFPLLQIILAALTAFAIFLIGKIFWKPSVGIIAGALYLLDPVTIMNSFIIMSDILYVFLLVFAIYFFFVSKYGEKINWAVGGFLLGLSTLVRPISMYLLIILILFYAIRMYRRDAGWKNFAAPVIFCLIMYIIVISPWVIRNKVVTGVYGISSVKSYNLYHYNVPEFLAFKNGITPIEARKVVKEGLGTFNERSLAHAHKMESRAMEFILDDFLGYGFFHIVKTIPFFVSSGMEAIFTSYNDAVQEEVFPVIKENLTSLLLKGRISEIFMAVSKNSAIFGEQVILIGLWMLALLAVYIAYRRKELFKVMLLWVIILYFAFLTGPVAHARYRLPASPFLFLLVAYTLVISVNTREYGTIIKPHETSDYHPKSR